MKRENSYCRRVSTASIVWLLLLSACSGGDGDTNPTDAPAGNAAPDSTGSTDSTPDGSTADDTSASSAASSSEPIRLGIQLEPGSMDLTSEASAGIPQVLLYNVYETLLKLGPDDTYEPLLAESYEVSDDGLTLSFKLREGIKFHGGQDFTAEDVVYSIENVLTKEPAHPFKDTLAPIDTVTAVDDYNVEIKLKQPSANVLFYLTQGQGSILDSEEAGDLAANANGTGPFTFGEWVVGDHITIDHNDAYWGEPALAPSVTYRYISDPGALSNALLAGEVDIVPNISAPEQFPAIEADPRFVTEVGETFGEIVLSVNGDNPPLDDVRVRQAITHAIDSEAVRDTAYQGYGSLIGTFSTPLDSYFKDNNDAYPYDPEKAVALLDEAGATHLKLRLLVPPTSYADRSAEVIQSQLAEVGITVEITKLDAFGTWIQQVLTDQDYDLSIVAHVEPRDLAKYGDVEYYWGPDSPAVADIVAEADATLDPVARDALYQSALDDVTAQAADTWLFVLPLLSAAKAEVTGYEPSALSLNMAQVAYNP